ncbi:MAG: spore germination protein [Dethiobacteria bacterium]|jgi:spore germination protein KA
MHNINGCKDHTPHDHDQRGFRQETCTDFTAIASFTTPIFTLGLSARLLRFTVIALSAAFGLLGVQFGLLILLVHLVSLRSFGLPYLAPFGPFIREDIKDSLINLSWWQMVFRPKLHRLP